MTTFGGENADSYYDEGLTATIKGDIKAAITYFEKAARIDPSMATAYHQLGKCYARIGDPQKAFQFLSNVVKKRPKLTTARLDLAGVMLQLNQFEPARQQLQFILQSEPENSKAYLGLARADFQDGNWQGALNHAKTAESLSGVNFPNTFMLGKSAKLAGDSTLSSLSLSKADKLIEKYQELNTDKPEGHFLRGEVAFVREDFTGALTHYRTAEEHANKDVIYQAYGETFAIVDILAKQGLCLQRLDEKDRAAEIGKRIAEIDPDHPLGRALCERSGEEDS